MKADRYLATADRCAAAVRTRDWDGEEPITILGRRNGNGI